MFKEHGMTIRHVIRKETYFDSVTLMQITNEVKKLQGVENAVVGMGTDYNVDSLKRLGLYSDVFAGITPADLLMCVQAGNDAAAEAALAGAEKLLTSRKKPAGGAAFVPPTQEAAAKTLPDANIVVISVPGAWAAREAEIALRAGRHVMLFSDNVTVEEELKLKTLGEQKNLLVMGPDCGTALINGVPLAFSNAIRKGNIGLVAASGTGLQEVTSLIHTMGYGITQAIGVGGRDLSEKIGGKMTLMAARALGEDPATKVIVMISKPPAQAVLGPLYAELKKIRKPIVVYFIGADPEAIRKEGFTPAHNLQEAAIKACELSGGKPVPAPMSEAEALSKAIGLKLPGTYLRGLYSGGTLCDEAQRVLQPVLGELYSNTPVKGTLTLKSVYKSEKHTIVDLGDDEFTRGRAHPMIDPSLRQERIGIETADPDVGLIAFDVVLGYGAHMDMAGEMVSAIEKARKASGRNPVFAACICGTADDPQNLQKQKRTLEDAGVLTFPSNLALVTFVKQALSGKGA